MNSKFDDLIHQALSAEDRALLASHAEPGYLAQAFGVFRGPLAGVLWLVNVVAALAFVGAAAAAWQLLQAANTLVALKWGVGCLFLFQISTLCKGFLGQHMEANRLLREIKRVEVQVALLREQSAG